MKCFLIVISVIACISFSDACSCMMEEGWEWKSYCESQFGGIIKVTGPSYTCGTMKSCYPIVVVQQLRGPSISPTVLETNNQSAACGITLQPDHIYFIATNPINANRITGYLCGLVQDWTSKTCCEMIALAKQYDCSSPPKKIEIAVPVPEEEAL